MLVAEDSQILQVFFGYDVKSSFTLYGFHNNGSHLVRGHGSMEKIFKLTEMDIRKRIRFQAIPISVMIRKRDAVNFRGKRATTRFISNLGSQSHGHHGSSVKSAAITNNSRSAGGLPRDLNGIL